MKLILIFTLTLSAVGHAMCLDDSEKIRIEKENAYQASKIRVLQPQLNNARSHANEKKQTLDALRSRREDHIETKKRMNSILGSLDKLVAEVHSLYDTISENASYRHRLAEVIDRTKLKSPNYLAELKSRLHDLPAPPAVLKKWDTILSGIVSVGKEDDSIRTQTIDLLFGALTMDDASAAQRFLEMFDGILINIGKNAEVQAQVSAQKAMDLAPQIDEKQRDFDAAQALADQLQAGISGIENAIRADQAKLDNSRCAIRPAPPSFTSSGGAF